VRIHTTLAATTLAAAAILGSAGAAAADPDPSAENGQTSDKPAPGGHAKGLSGLPVGQVAGGLLDGGLPIGG
jgi:hypothetical protein